MTDGTDKRTMPWQEEDLNRFVYDIVREAIGMVNSDRTILLSDDGYSHAGNTLLLCELGINEKTLVRIVKFINERAGTNIDKKKVDEEEATLNILLDMTKNDLERQRRLIRKSNSAVPEDRLPPSESPQWDIGGGEDNHQQRMGGAPRQRGQRQRHGKPSPPQIS